MVGDRVIQWRENFEIMALRPLELCLVCNEPTSHFSLLFPLYLVLPLSSRAPFFCGYCVIQELKLPVVAYMEENEMIVVG